MIRRIWAIGLTTYREALRQRVLYALIFFTVALLLFSFFLGQLSFGADTKIIKDVGLASIMFLGAMLAIFIGVGLVHREIERRTIYTILSKPVTRTEFLIGKFVGLAMTIGLEVAVMAGLVFCILSAYVEPLDFNLLKAVAMIYFELCVVIAATLLFSSYSSSFMSALFSISFLLLGHVTDDFATIFAPKAGKLAALGGLEGIGGNALWGIIHLLNLISLDHFAIGDLVVHGVPVSWGWILNGALRALCWVVLLLYCAALLFRKKDLK
jgi:ABC-type transport system involved in multi-copper enzyme maturation permease subunit